MKFSNLKSKRGSVLFIVLLVMSVLIVMAAAVYFAVNSNYESIVADYEEKQTYQTALSVNNVIDSYISNNMESTFVQKMISLNVGDVIYSSSAAGATQAQFQEFNDAISAFNLGKYSVTITKKKGEPTDTSHVFQIIVETELDGEKSRTESWCTLDLGTIAEFNRFFTATGYTPQDVTISGTEITSTMYLDNEYTRLSHGSYLNINKEIICSGTLYFDDVPTGDTATTPFDITVGNNFYITGNQATMDLKGGNLKIGANWICSASAGYKLTNGTTTYVVGDCIYGGNGSDSGSDLYINGDLVILSTAYFKGNVYVNGDLIVAGSASNNFFDAGKMSVTGNVYVRDNYSHMGELATRLGVDESSLLEFTSTIPGTDVDKYDVYKNFITSVKEENGKDPLYTPTAASWVSICTNDIESKIGNYVYVNWDLKKLFLNQSGTDANGNALYNNNTDYKTGVPKYNINFGVMSDAAMTAEDGKVAGVDIKYSDFSGWDGNRFPNTATVYQSCIIESSQINHNMQEPQTIYFDTNDYDGSGNLVMEGSMPKYHNIYVYLAPGSDNTFKWNTGSYQNRTLNILVKGRGSVIFVLSEGTTYVAQQHNFVGHEGWYKLRGNKGYVTATEIFGFTNNIGSNLQINPSVISGAYGTGSTDTYIHNNIFLVAIDVNSDLDFTAANTFCGFIYAPYMEFATSGPDGSVSIVGGVISSSYTMEQTTRKYICTIPYDYYTPGLTEKQRKNVLQDLMSSTGHSTPLSPTTSKGWKVYGYN